MNKFNFKIGADPEFIMVMQGKKVDAKRTMELMLTNKKDLTLTRDGGGFTVKGKGQIGWDGASSTAEIRPEPNSDPQKVVNNLAKILQTTVKYIKICDMTTLSELSSIGGHIHFELPKGEIWTTQKAIMVHKKMASFYLPILVSENKINLALRIRQGYGKISDQRVERRFKYLDGTQGYTFEFRVPSAEWMTTPKLANATMAYMGVIYHEIINHPESFKKMNDMIYKTNKQGEALQTLAIQEFNLLTKAILNKAKKYVKTFEMYPKYKKEIDYIFSPKTIIKEKNKANYNIVKGWKLIEETKQPKKAEIMRIKTDKIQEIAKKKDFDSIKGIINIVHNDDTNVSLFVGALKNRIAAFDWKLNKNYCIFGMRKGINEIIAKNMGGDILKGNKQIKTQRDIDEIGNLFGKMTSKFGLNNTRYTKTIDFKTGNPIDKRNSTIIIGLPYEMRIEENIKKFLNLIWDLEKGKKEVFNKEKSLIDDWELELGETGKIYRILTNQMKTEEQNIIVDENSISLTNSTQAIHELVNETAVQQVREQHNEQTSSQEVEPDETSDTEYFND